MDLYEIGLRTTATAAAVAALELRNPAASRRMRLWELAFSQVTAVAGVYGIGRAAASGTGGTVNNLLPMDPANTTTPALQAFLAATGAATVPAAFPRRIGLPATVGAGWVWTWREGLVIPAGTSIVLWNIAAVPALDVYAVLEEL